MKKIELRHRLYAPLILCALPFAAFSCVDSEYDIDKPFDMTVNFLKDAALPVGNVKKLYLKDILLGTDETLVGTSADGDYYLTFVQGQMDTEIKVPSFEYGGFTKNVQIVPELTKAADAGRISGTVDFGTIHFNCNMESHDLPEEVTGLKRCEVVSSIQLSLQTAPGQGLITLPSGAEIRFPEFLVIASGLQEGISKTGPNVFTTTRDFPIANSLDFIFPVEAIDFEAVPDGEGLLAPGHFKMTADILLSGSVRVDNIQTDAFPDITGKLQLNPARFVRAVAKLSKETGIPVSPVMVGDLPEFLNGENLVLDLQGLRLDMAVENTFPLGGNMRAGIRTSGTSGTLASVALGPVHFSAPALGQTARSAFSFSQSGTGAPQGYADVRTADFDNLLRIIPQQVGIYGMTVSVDDTYAEIGFGMPYKISADYSLASPLAFGKDVEMSFVQDMTGLGIDLSDFGLTKAQLTLDAVSSVPLEFSLQAEAIDAGANVISGIDVLLEGKIIAGSLDNPSESKLILNLSAEGADVAFDGLRLRMSTISGGPSLAGIPLNEAQGIEMKNLVLRVPEGITLDLGGDEDE